MSTAQAYYELYKVLPKKVKREVMQLIQDEDYEKIPLKTQIEEGLKEIKLIREGKLNAKTLDELIFELEHEI